MSDNDCELHEEDHPKLKLPPLEKLIAPPDYLEKAAVLIEQARTAYTDGKHEVAEEALTVALRRNPGYYLADVGKWPVRNFFSLVRPTTLNGFQARQLASPKATSDQLENWSRHYDRGVLDRHRDHNYHKAITALLAAHEAAPPNSAPGWALNNLAYGLATCPEKQIRDVEAATEFSKQACALTDWHYWAFLGTLARCYAEAEDFEKAARVTEAYLKNCPEKKLEGSSEPPVGREEWEFNLKRFKEGKPWQGLPGDEKKDVEKSKEPTNKP